MTALITLQELKSYLKIKLDNIEDDAMLTTIINQCSSLVENYCGRVFSVADYSEYFDGGVTKLYINNPPIQYMSGVYVYNGASYVLAGNPDPYTGRFLTGYGQSNQISNVGDPEFSSRSKKFGDTSLRLTGTQYVAGTISDDFSLQNEDFCIESQVRFANNNAIHTVFSWGADASNCATLAVDFVSRGLTFNVVSSGSQIFEIKQNDTTGYDTTSWKHIAVSRSGDTFKLFREGVVLATETSSISIPEYTGAFNIGRNIVESNYFSGYLDETRLSWASRYTGTYTPPTIPYATDSYTKLLIHYNGSTIDDSRNVNQYLWDKESGEVTVDTSIAHRELRVFNVATFRNYPNAVKIDYSGGYTSTPDDLKNAVMELARLHYRGYPGIKARSFQNETESKEQLSPDGLPFHVRRILNLYRII